MRKVTAGAKIHERIQIKVRASRSASIYELTFTLRFKQVYFIDGSSPESIQTDFINLVRSSDPNVPAFFEDAMNFLCNPENFEWLLVYDNVDDVNLELNDFLPQCSHGFIILTTRNALLGAYASNGFHIELNVMHEKEAVKAIMNSAKLPDSAVNSDPIVDIANELGCLPGALVQAGSYMFKSKCTPAGYLQRLRDHKTELMRRPTSDPQKYSAYAAFDLSYECLSPMAQSLLLLLSFFHHVDFPMEAIHQAAEVEFRHDPFTFEERDNRFEECVKFLLSTFCTVGAGKPVFSILTIDEINEELQSYSLASITSTPISALIRIHPLIHSWASSRVPVERQDVMRSAAVRLMASAAKERRLAVYMTPHITSILSKDTGNTLSFNDRAIFGEVMRIARRTGNAQEIWESIYRSIVGTDGDDMQPEDHRIETIDAMAYLANTYRGQIHHSKAEGLKEKVLECRRLHLGETHLSTLEAMASLANTRRWRGRFNEAESLETQVLESRKLQLGENHPDTLQIMSNLAHTYFLQGRISDAEAMNKQVLDARKVLLPASDPAILQAKSNLAHSYMAQGRYSDAEILQDEVLEERTKALGISHPETLTAMKNIAFTYRSQRHYDKAVALQKTVLDERRKMFGETHQDTFEAMRNLAATYRLQGRHVMNGAMRVDGTADSESSLNEVKEATRRFKGLHAESEKLQRQVLIGKETVLGENHLDTIKAIFDLATTCGALGRISEAEELHEKVYLMRKSQLGETHQDTLQSLSALAYIKCARGHYSEAKLMQKRVVVGMDQKNIKWMQDMERIGFR
jgi:tetratricopeptide (TPR) repeat protein